VVAAAAAAVVVVVGVEASSAAALVSRDQVVSKWAAKLIFQRKNVIFAFKNFKLLR
jgi:hypothetical protein